MSGIEVYSGEMPDHRFFRHQNFCVAADGTDLVQTDWPMGNESRQMCADECMMNDQCSGYEWYENKMGDNNCFLLETGWEDMRVAGGEQGGQWLDAVCYERAEWPMTDDHHHEC